MRFAPTAKAMFAGALLLGLTTVAIASEEAHGADQVARARVGHGQANTCIVTADAIARRERPGQAVQGTRLVQALPQGHGAQDAVTTLAISHPRAGLVVETVRAKRQQGHGGHG